jgi:N,N'-diacetyllegionaminate synthase
LILRHHTLIIAEVGVNHNGDIRLAKQLVDCAVRVGADVVKFQTFTAQRLVTQDAPKADYQKKTTEHAGSQFDMLRKLELTPQMHRALLEYCEKQGIEFFSTGFDIESLEYLNKLGVVRFKVPSGEITNLPFLRRVASFGVPIILSTGMSTLGEIESAITVFEEKGADRSKITILHCNTEYPTPIGDVNLKAMCTIRDAFGTAVGYSDHTEGIEIPIAAVALGATVIEKHLTLNRNLPGPDHKASLEPGEFAAMVRAIRNIERAMGDGIKRPSASEAKNRVIVRKSLVAAKLIRAGEVFTMENVTEKRPGTGISPMRWDEVMGRIAPRNFSVDELIEL